MKIKIITEGASGDEEVAEALQRIVTQYENEGDVRGNFYLDDGEHVDWAINPGEPGQGVN